MFQLSICMYSGHEIVRGYIWKKNLHEVLMDGSGVEIRRKCHMTLPCDKSNLRLAWFFSSCRVFRLTVYCGGICKVVPHAPLKVFVHQDLLN